jgi:hypothetical protein
MTGEHVIETPDETWSVERLLKYIDEMWKDRKFVDDGYERRGRIAQLLIQAYCPEDGWLQLPDQDAATLAELMIREAGSNPDFRIGDEPMG